MSTKDFPSEEISKHCRSLSSATLVLAAVVLRRLKQGRGKSPRCRTCLSTHKLKDIFDGHDACREEDLLKATGLQIQKNDGLPQTICESCSKIIQDYITFQKACKKADAKLKKWGYSYCKTTDNIPEATITNIKDEKIDFFDNWDDMYVTNECVNEKYEPAVYEEYMEQAVEQVVKKKRKKKKSNMPPFKCHVCKKILANASSLRTHLNWHTGQTAYICETCGKRCINRTAFLQHMKGKHGLQRTDKCSYCDYMALNKEQLKIHERRHTGERPYICDHCGSGFHRRANLVQHLPTHLPVNTIQCDLCPSKFKSAKFLATHKSRAHSNRHYSYVCHVCNSSYKKSFNVRKHLVKVHGVPREHQGDITRVKVRSFNDVPYAGP